MASSKKIGRSVEESVDKALSNISSAKPDMKGGDTELKSAVAPQKAMTRGEAFKAARLRGDKTFTWGGKSYHTRTAEEEAKARSTSVKSAATAAKPAATTAKPAAAKADVKPETARFLRNLRQGVYRDATGKGYVSDKVSPARNPKNNKVERSEVTPISSLKSQPATKANWNKGLGKSGPAPLQRQKEEPRKPGSLLMKPVKEERKPGSLLMKPVNKAKGGKIDGAAIRGKTRAPLKKGK